MNSTPVPVRVIVGPHGDSVWIVTTGPCGMRESVHRPPCQCPPRRHPRGDFHPDRASPPPFHIPCLYDMVSIHSVSAAVRPTPDNTPIINSQNNTSYSLPTVVCKAHHSSNPSNPSRRDWTRTFHSRQRPRKGGPNDASRPVVKYEGETYACGGYVSIHTQGLAHAISSTWG